MSTLRPPRVARPVVALALAATLLALAGCALLRGRPPEDRITLELPVSRAEAVRRTLASFRVQGYRVRESLTSASEPETEPFRHGGEAEAVFRAAVTGTGRSARVVLSGTYRKRQFGGVVRAREQVVRNTDDPLEQELWNRLHNLSLAIRQPPR
jgi:hypothetical protein